MKQSAIKIKSVTNGYLVFPDDDRLKETYVFETFARLVEWLSTNLECHGQKEETK